MRRVLVGNLFLCFGLAIGVMAQDQKSRQLSNDDFAPPVTAEASAPPEKVNEFPAHSANISFNKEGSFEINSCRAVTDQSKVKIEMEIFGGSLVYLLTDNKKFGTFLNIRDKDIFKSQFDTDSSEVLYNLYTNKYKRTPAGSETIEGQVCNKFKLVDGESNYVLWLNKSTKLPVKLQSLDNKFNFKWVAVELGANKNEFQLSKEYKPLSK